MRMNSLKQSPAYRLVRDAGLAISLPFRRGAGKIEPLMAIAADAESSGKREISASGGATIYSGSCFSVVQKARLKIAEIKASQGKYGEAISQCELMCSIAPEFSKQSVLPLAFKAYYEGKIEKEKGDDASKGQSSVLKVYGAVSKKSEAREHFMKSAESIEQACGLFITAKKFTNALEVGEEAIALYEKLQMSMKVVQLCKLLAPIAYDRSQYLLASQLYGKASDLEQGKSSAEDARMAAAAANMVSMESWHSFPATS